MKPFAIYLCGPMDQVSHSVMTDWREEAKRYFLPDIRDGFVKLLDPCRRPHTSNLTPVEIYQLDMIDVRSSDLLLVDIRYMPRETWGTATEIAVAYEYLKIPIIGWKGPDPITARRTFLNVMCSHQFEKLIDALEHIQEYYICGR